MRRAQKLAAGIAVVMIASAVGAPVSFAADNAFGIDEMNWTKSDWDSIAMTNDDTVDTGAVIRTSADEDSKAAGYLYRGAAAQVVDKGEEWTEVKSGKVSGYVKNEFLAYGDKARGLAAHYGEQGVVANWNEVNVFSDNNADSPVETQLKDGTPMSMVEDNGHWITVQHGTDSAGYVSEEDVTRVLLVDTAVPAEGEDVADVPATMTPEDIPAKNASVESAESSEEASSLAASGEDAEPSGEDSYAAASGEDAAVYSEDSYVASDEDTVAYSEDSYAASGEDAAVYSEDSYVAASSEDAAAYSEDSYVAASSEDATASYEETTYTDDSYTDDSYTDGSYTDTSYTETSYTEASEETYTETASYTEEQSTQTYSTQTVSDSTDVQALYDAYIAAQNAAMDCTSEEDAQTKADAAIAAWNAYIAAAGGSGDTAAASETTSATEDSSADEAYAEYTEYTQTQTEAAVQEETEPAVQEQTEAPAASSGSSAYGNYSDLDLLAAIIWCEAGNQSYDGMVAVGQVVMNRVASSSFPNTVSEVLNQAGQFTPASAGTLQAALASGVNSTCYQAAQDAMSGASPVPGTPMYFNTHSGSYKLGAHYFS